MNGKKIYYLETNALYSLANYLGVIAEKVEAHTSLFAIQEIISQIDEDNYYKRKSVLSKLRSSNLKIMPHLPKEMVMLAFGLNISELDQIKYEKSLLWNQVMLVCSSSSYDEYCKKAKKMYDFDAKDSKEIEDAYDKNVTTGMQEEIYKDIQKIKTRRKKEKEICQKYGVKSLSELPPNPHIEGVEYVTIDVDRLFLDEENVPEKGEDIRDIKELAQKILHHLEIACDEVELDALVRNRNKERLTAFMLGNLSYRFSEIFSGKTLKRNDAVDLCHLIYLENENYVIVSDDKIFESCTMPQMRIKTTALKALCE